IKVYAVLIAFLSFSACGTSDKLINFTPKSKQSKEEHPAARKPTEYGLVNSDLGTPGTLQTIRDSDSVGNISTTTCLEETSTLPAIKLPVINYKHQLGSKLSLGGLFHFCFPKQRVMPENFILPKDTSIKLCYNERVLFEKKLSVKQTCSAITYKNALSYECELYFDSERTAHKAWGSKALLDEAAFIVGHRLRSPHENVPLKAFAQKTVDFLESSGNKKGLEKLHVSHAEQIKGNAQDKQDLIDFCFEVIDFKPANCTWDIPEYILVLFLEVIKNDLIVKVERPGAPDLTSEPSKEITLVTP
ncbi:MAG: hypothetical protein AAFQ01_00060, partial [Bacteroidota bacterium]